MAGGTKPRPGSKRADTFQDGARKKTGETMTTPVLQVRHAEGNNWCVAATWPDGRFEEIAGFPTESEANEWIANRFQNWLDEHERKKSA